MDFLFRPTAKQTALTFAAIPVLLIILGLLTGAINPARADEPPVFQWEGIGRKPKVALVAKFGQYGECQVFRVRDLDRGSVADGKDVIYVAVGTGTNRSCVVSGSGR